MNGKAALAAALLAACAALAAGEGISPPRPSTLVTDRFGRPLRAYLDGPYASACVPVRLHEVSPWLVLATLAAEDKRFFSHSGVDLLAAARAMAQNLKSGRTVSGASTITQQLARALEPRRRGLFGKVGEMFSALRLESGHSKEQILESYLNGVPYGPRLTGAGAAALDYFGSGTAALTPAQSAFLAGLPKSPVSYEPRRHPRAAFARQRQVLRRMFDLGFMDEETYRLALAEKVSVKERAAAFSAPHFSDLALRRGVALTTLDARVQEAADRTLANQLSALSARNHVKNGAVLVVDNATGGVLAWVGSNDFFDEVNGGQVDGVTALRQPGSALKPFLYGLALARGAKASDLLDDTPLYAAGGHAPSNYDKTYHGRVRLREALACSYNVPAVRVAQKVGVPALLAKLRELGFDSLARDADFYGEGLALGNGEVTLLELVNAYATLARGGIWLPVRVGREEPVRARRVLGRGEAYIITDILSDNSARSPAFGLDSAFNLPFDLAAKTGTTKDYRDNWAVGYTPEWTIGVWVGNFNGEPMRRVSGITGAAPVLKEVALEMKRLYGSTPFKRPPGIKTGRVCPVSGAPVSPFCPSSIEELFLPGDKLAAECREHDPAGPPVPHAAAARVEFPKDGDVFRLDPQAPAGSQGIFFRTDFPGKIKWVVDGKELAAEGRSVLWLLTPGVHSVHLVSAGDGPEVRSARVRFRVLD